MTCSKSFAGDRYKSEPLREQPNSKNLRRQQHRQRNEKIEEEKEAQDQIQARMHEQQVQYMPRFGNGNQAAQPYQLGAEVDQP